MKLSPNFSLAEMCRTSTGLPNEATPLVAQNLTLLCVKVLEPVRAHFGKPVRVNSGYRSPAVNKAVGSKPTSQHGTGQAADIEIDGVSNLELARWIEKYVEFDQLILEAHRKGDPNSGWVHVSYRAAPKRQQVLTMTLGTHGAVYTAGLPK